MLKDFLNKKIYDGDNEIELDFNGEGPGVGEDVDGGGELERFKMVIRVKKRTMNMF